MKFADLLKWYWILLIVLGALLLILIIFLIVRNKMTHNVFNL